MHKLKPGFMFFFYFYFCACIMSAQFILQASALLMCNSHVQNSKLGKPANLHIVVKNNALCHSPFLYSFLYCRQIGRIVDIVGCHVQICSSEWSICLGYTGYVKQSMAWSHKTGTNTHTGGAMLRCHEAERRKKKNNGAFRITGLICVKMLLFSIFISDQFLHFGLETFKH